MLEVYIFFTFFSCAKKMKVKWNLKKNMPKSFCFFVYTPWCWWPDQKYFFILTHPSVSYSWDRNHWPYHWRRFCLILELLGEETVEHRTSILAQRYILLLETTYPDQTSWLCCSVQRCCLERKGACRKILEGIEEKEKMGEKKKKQRKKGEKGRKQKKKKKGKMTKKNKNEIERN